MKSKNSILQKFHFGSTNINNQITINVAAATNNFVSSKFKESSLQYLIKNIVFVGQCFALWPVDGLRNNKVKFQWFSFKTLYTVFIIIFQIIYTVIISFWTNLDLKKFFNFVVIMWNVRALCELIIFLKIGITWPALVRKFTEVELEMKNYCPIPNLRLRFKILSYSFTILGFSEHLLFVSGAIRKVLSIKTKDQDFFKIYFETIYQEIFNVIEYNHWRGAVIEILSLISTFAWQFCDLIIILLTLTLSERFGQIAKKIKTENYSKLQWDKLRDHYQKLSLLCTNLNSVISEMVLLSLIGNIYFMSVSILQAFTPKTPYVAVYFWYGILLSIMHFSLVCYYAARVDEESSHPLSYLLSVPLENSPVEVDRFIFQIVENHPAIYVGGMFKITRSTILHVTSVILTLQLVYDQFKTTIPTNVQD